VNRLDEIWSALSTLLGWPHATIPAPMRVNFWRNRLNRKTSPPLMQHRGENLPKNRTRVNEMPAYALHAAAGKNT